MLMLVRSWRVLFPLVAIGIVLLLISVFLVSRDLTYAHNEAEGEVVALAETAALTMQFAPAKQIDSYLSGLVQHPAIAMATVYSSDGRHIVKSRTSGAESPFIRFIARFMREPIVGCKAIGEGSICLTADMTYFRRRVAALILPHAILLGASAVLLVVALILGRGSNRRQLIEIARVLDTASAENNYALRATGDKGEVGALAVAANKLLEQMQQRDLILRRRTTELESANNELEAFTYAVSHDLRSPLAAVDGFTDALIEDYRNRLDETGQEFLGWVHDGIEQMKNLVAGLLQMSRASRAEISRTRVNMSEMAQSIATMLRLRDPSRVVDFRIASNLIVSADERLLHAVLENLMSNAYKFSGKREHAVIEIGSTTEGERRTYFVRDNGAGFDSTQAAKMFTPFQRLHTSAEFEGTGIGLSTVKRIVERHGGTIWAEGQLGEGATFYFTLGDASVEEAAETTQLTSV